MFEIPSRMITENMTADDLLQMSAIDWNQVDSILDKKRKDSVQYLDEVFC